MSLIKRSEKPQVLVLNEKQWTLDLLNELNNKRDFAKIPKNIVSRYSHDEIRTALRLMYKKRCCYCEGKISAQTYDHIEHLRPKSLFPHLTFTWKNLHCVCNVCNVKKGNQWDDFDSILDPTKDRVENFLDVDLCTGKIIAIKNNPRGLKTISYAQLNRETLIEERFAIIQRYSIVISYFESRGGILPKTQLKDILTEMIDQSSYPMVHKKILSQIK